ncbi:MAG: D-glycerate dehydrogenase [Chloroflexi bacterium]|jgi:glyoxylate reductase|uniref:D-glycerate dehydrogenase n=1 Tax=Candidatus Thermofonsia Clade 3 bacterium TaxID=2364212 RepID=A0A2M8QED8_9CHLR|nr:D-glycerate dehydrogenase [Candidatus Roseilinea sp. NK_OTU-006]PJF48164.1 MAG: D-glycerate dehydrogenase [Candidatus Thermofonsia Clade 3 bacterium]RMG61958.1 MAG: D-glycerate dehydrogenase [Chloroflexota bacterium]
MSKPRAFISRRIPQPAIDLIAAACDYGIWDDWMAAPRDVFLREAAQSDGVLVMPSEQINEEFLDAAPRVKIVANMAVGYDNIDVPALTRRGVLATNTPDVLTETTADIAWALLMAAARRVVEGHKTIEAGQWGAWHPFYMLGQDVYGATLGIVGAGRIGAAVARRAKAFNMRVLYHNRRRAPHLEVALGAEYRAFDDLLRESDFVVMTAPLTDETRGLFGAREFALMKDTAVFVNVARGGVVKEADLVEALKRGRPWAAGLDVFEVEPTPKDNPLFELPNFVGTPHIGSATLRTRTAMAMLAAQNLVNVLTGKPPLTPINALPNRV